MNYDVVVIGGGPAGYSCALEVSRLGLACAIVEQFSSLGGVCLHVGCIPSKTLLHASEYNVDKDISAFMQKKNHIIHQLSEGLRALIQSRRITCFTGKAYIVGPHELHVLSEEKEQVIQAKYIVIATGSRPAELPNVLFDEDKIVSSTGALEIRTIPEKLLIVGAGVIGLEMASLYQRLGSRVRVIELLPTLCQGFDSSIRQALLTHLQRQGIEFSFSTKVIAVEKQKKKVDVVVEHADGNREEILVDRVLVSIGRVPNNDSMGLERLSIRKDASNRIITDSCFRTNVDSIFAIGDVIKGPMLAHRASYEAVTLAHFLTGRELMVSMITVPNVIYTSPEVACCGLTEEECVEKKVPFIIGTSSLCHNGRALSCECDTGFVKIVAHKQDKRVLGVHIFAPNASEMIAVASFALRVRAHVRDLATLPFAHPSISEAIQEAAKRCMYIE